MAQIVGFFEDDIKYQEGPFVLTKTLGGDWRIEVECKGYFCSVIPDASIQKVICDEGFFITGKLEEKKSCVDMLNRKVKQGNIILDPVHEAMWIRKE